MHGGGLEGGRPIAGGQGVIMAAVGSCRDCLLDFSRRLDYNRGPKPPAPGGTSLMYRITPIALVILFAAPGAAPAQKAKAKAGPPPVVSPEVKSDRTVTFRLNAPKAS